MFRHTHTHTHTHTHIYIYIYIIFKFIQFQKPILRKTMHKYLYSSIWVFEIA